MSSSGTGSGSGASAFQQLDRNGDGYIDRSEANSSPGVKANFQDMDANHDGKLSPDEVSAYRSKSK